MEIAVSNTLCPAESRLTKAAMKISERGARNDAENYTHVRHVERARREASARALIIAI